jgi:hypothetical protein
MDVVMSPMMMTPMDLSVYDINKQQQQQQQQPMTSTQHPGKAAKLVPFLRKVQVLCETAPSHIARWSADGKQFDVLDPKGFDELLKVHFEGASPATFHRQLFFYGWVKLNHTNGGGDEKTKGTWSFRHPCFLRDEPSRIYEIRRYARASDREEQEDGSRVDILERRVSALQSLVDDLSRKLAAVQLTLDRAPLPVATTVAAQQPAVPVVAAPAAVPAPVVSTDKPGRKRMKDIDEDFLAGDLRLTEDDFLHLFDDLPGTPAAASTSAPDVQMTVNPIKRSTSFEVTIKPKHSRAATTDEQQKHAQELISSFMSTPQFQAAISSTIQEKPATKVEAVPPHLSVC